MVPSDYRQRVPVRGAPSSRHRRRVTRARIARQGRPGWAMTAPRRTRRSGSPMLDATSRTLQYALDGLTMRQTVLSDNIANEGTPGYQAKAVDFETELTHALGDGAEPSAKPVIAGTGAAAQPDGNNVDLGDALVGMQT